MRSRTRAAGRDAAAQETPAGELPLRDELYSAERMKRHGKVLARAHRVRAGVSADLLLPRLRENEVVLVEACDLLTDAVKANRRITPAGEWLLDNFHLVEEQILLARRHLPKGYSRQLPKLREGPSARLPRVYDIALETISHGDGRVDTETLSRFVAAYQSVTPLMLGELWAIPIMLRLALIENLRRVAARVIADRRDRDLADVWADRMIRAAERDPKSLILAVADMARSNPPASSSFVAELARRLHGQGAGLALPLGWIEQLLAESGGSIEQSVRAENRHQAADQVSISNSIGSLRYLSAMDWREFVETMSVVEQALREDPAGMYAQMDFATRDEYRHVAERIARRCDRSEDDVARAAVMLARGASGAAATEVDATEVGATDSSASSEPAGAALPRDAGPAGHVGYWLIGDGLTRLERAVGMTPTVRTRLGRSLRRVPLTIYLGSIALLGTLYALQLLGEFQALGWSHGALIAVALLGLVAGSELAQALANWAITVLSVPQPLPRLDYSEGIPAEARTLVVVPTLLGDESDIEALIEALEVRHLANRDDNLHFALLSDHPDAREQTLPHDAARLALAQGGIEALNNRYSEYGNRFFLLHRPRRWNPRERRWMGWERKRGKLAELNALLRGHGRDRFERIVGDTEVLSNVRYVITLDTDTRLPLEAARTFVGTMAHPLNRPRYDARRTRVSAGYGILQPRVGTSLGDGPRSTYARLFGSEPGIDPYTRAVSDVYQDLFAEGSFVGKGIYDVDAFEQTMAGRFPENRILSHDLLEGCYARSGLMSDGMLFEDYPSRYGADVARRHRWIRGDWQLLPWLLPWVRRGDGRRERNPLSSLSRWKILDNLRRSLVPAALLALLPLGWATLAHPAAWTAAVLAVPLVPVFIQWLAELLDKPREILLAQHLRTALVSGGRRLLRALFAIATLPYEAVFSLDAILRTLWRIGVTRRRLLLWSPSAQVERRLRGGLDASVRAMWSAPVLASIGFAWLGVDHPGAVPVATPVLALWFGSPVFAWWLGRSRPPRAAQLDAAQLRYLRRLARRTWAFFETWVGPDDHWLPPDNVQYEPQTMPAHRTSPTNIGLSLLGNLAAHDFGYISASVLIDRTSKTLETLTSMQRHRGHFYNWYDTQTLQPLPPHYVSTVDSGNLAGHLLVLRQGLLGLVDAPLLHPRTFAGIEDTVDALAIVAGAVSEDDADGIGLAALREALAAARHAFPSTFTAARSVLADLAARAEALQARLGDRGGKTRAWAQALTRQCADALEELDRFASWPIAGTSADTAGVGLTLRALASHADAGVQADSALVAAAARAQACIAEIERLAAMAEEFSRVDYSFLYDRSRHLLSIGYNVDERRLDAGYYDLLASEARLCSYLAIAQGRLPQENWFALGRLLTSVEGEAVLLSWSGSMFEYLMPQLVMPSFEDTLLDRSMRACVDRQIEYGRRRGVPWGISESGYSTVDLRMNYQYRAFGVPGLGLKRGLSQDLVIAPYATMLALMVAPEEACANLHRMSADGFEGDFGFFEAIDYTPGRLPRGQPHVVVRQFMAHHQGMSLLALSHLLLERPMQRRFAADAQLQATQLLLQERVPKTAVFHPHAGEFADVSAAIDAGETHLRVFDTPSPGTPAVQMLSNGRYHVMLTAAGGGYSRYRDLAVTRWREDATIDTGGAFCYLRDVGSGEFWSTAYLPTGVSVGGYQAIFSDARAEFRGGHLDYETHTEIVVSPEDDIELRRLRITNRSHMRRTVEVTSYAEVVLTTPVADALHPAFSNLFVRTEIVPDRQTILCTRRPRDASERPPYMFHLMAAHGARAQAVSYETDRARFIGRGNTLADPDALRTEALADSQGSVLDPIVAVRCRISLDPEQTVTLDMVTGVGGNRDRCLALADKYRDRHLADRVFDLAWTHSQLVLRQLNATAVNAQLYERLAGSILLANRTHRSDPGVIAQNRRGQSGLWGQGISGDLPIVLVQIAAPANIELVRQMVQAHAYWRLKGLGVDLVIWNEDQVGYRQQLHDQIMGLIAAGPEAATIDRPGGIFVRPAQQLSSEDRILVQSVARVVVSDARGTLVEQITRRRGVEALPAAFAPSPVQYELVPVTAPHALQTFDDTWPFELPPDALILDNGLGGFSRDGREYVITLRRGQPTPAPWCNVLANPRFGTVVSESGPGYTWSENAHEFRLTPWHNDAVTDASGEAYYLRDEESGRIWSPTPLPARGEGDYRVRHGFGYSVYEHVEDGIASELWTYVAIEAPIKFCVLRLRNGSGRSRRLSVTGYVEWVLGDLRAKTAPHVVTALDPGSGAILARNAWNTEFAGRAGFFDADGKARSLTGDRAEFLGRNGTLRAPAALARMQLSGRLGAASDPCAAIQVPVELSDGEEKELVFRLGAGQSVEETAALALAHRGAEAARDALDAVRIHWRGLLGAVQIQTPEPAVDALANGWLLYQVIACRFWGRSGFYQSGGAIGFRDQLQDSMAMLHAAPAQARAHLLKCAAHQFGEGDVQHWWHPPLDRGVRTRCSDDFLWLPHAVCRYVQVTGDHRVLNESAPYISGRAVSMDEESYYDLPARTGQYETLYRHCVRAIERGLAFGERGLPLMGTGDWNDGMNRVGERGRGESVWLGFFLYDVLQRFVHIAERQGDADFASRCLQEAERLRGNLDLHAWDGAWYRRAWFDDGTPLGAQGSAECEIDSIAQSWSVLSGAGDPVRVRQAMRSLDERLVRRESGLIQLLDPPFERSEPDPGYIRGYAPGVRENGGQYTHAAVWATMAFAELGDADKAWELLRLINPVGHAGDPAGVDTYRVEPYVAAADVYAVAPHTGRGGWTWYTGSAGWMYRLIVESLLGVQREGGRLRIAPRIPAEWPGFELRYRFGDTTYRIEVVRDAAQSQGQRVLLDGIEVQSGVIALSDDHREHHVEVRLPPGA